MFYVQTLSRQSKLKIISLFFYSTLSLACTIMQYYNQLFCFFLQDWFVIRSKAKSSKFDKLHKTQPKEDSMNPDVPSPNTAVGFPQALDAWQHRQTPAAATSSGTTEIKEKEGRDCRKEKKGRQGKDCYEFSDSETSSSESEPEDPVARRRDDLALSGPLTKPGSNQRPRSKP